MKGKCCAKYIALDMLPIEFSYFRCKELFFPNREQCFAFPFSECTITTST